MTKNGQNSTYYPVNGYVFFCLGGKKSRGRGRVNEIVGGIRMWIFWRKMGVRWRNGCEILGFVGRNLAFGLKTGILGGAIGHLVFGNWGKKTA